MVHITMLPPPPLPAQTTMDAHVYNNTNNNAWQGLVSVPLSSVIGLIKKHSLTQFMYS